MRDPNLSALPVFVTGDRVRIERAVPADGGQIEAGSTGIVVATSGPLRLSLLVCGRRVVVPSVHVSLQATRGDSKGRE